jgi:gliding motility-associated-like protein
MKVLTCFFCLFLSFQLAAQVEQGLVAHFSFDKPNCEISDEKGDPDVQANAIGDVFCACGVEDSSLYFDGDGDFFFLYGSDVDKVFTTVDFSLSFYFKPTTNNPQPVALFSKRNSNCTSDSSFIIRYIPVSRLLSVEMVQNSQISGSIAKSLPYSCWYHIVVVRKGATTLLYVNGQEAGSTTAPGSLRVNVQNSEPMVVGSTQCSQLEQDFQGFMDEIRLYNRALKREEVEDLYLFPDQIGNGSSIVGLNDTTIFKGNSVQAFVQSSCATDFSWAPTDGVSDPNISNPIITPAETTTYGLTFSDQFLCVITDSLRITVIDPSTIDCNDILLPSAFTPNADGRNDTYGISNPFVAGEILSFEIYDRWGNIVFSTLDALARWDGSYKGKPVNPGVFLYKILYRCKGEEGLKSGSVTVIR